MSWIFGPTCDLSFSWKCLLLRQFSIFMKSSLSVIAFKDCVFGIWIKIPSWNLRAFSYVTFYEFYRSMFCILVYNLFWVNCWGRCTYVSRFKHMYLFLVFTRVPSCYCTSHLKGIFCMLHHPYLLCPNSVKYTSVS